MNQIELYNKIDDFLSQECKNANVKSAKYFIDYSFDSKDYFFAQAPVYWISWLNENGFFDVLNVEVVDKAKFSLNMPELGYLVRVVESNDGWEEVLKVVNSVDCARNFNPEVIDRFLWIATKLPLKQLIEIVQKINKENWVKLMKGYSISEYNYEQIIKKLVEKEEYESLLLLGESMLFLNAEREDSDPFDNYFYFGDLGHSGIFDALADLKGGYAEKGIELIFSIFKDLVKDKTKKEESVFEYFSGFDFYDVDLFDISINKRHRSNDREGIKSLLAVLVALISERIGKNCEDDVREVYSKYFEKLPDTQYMWRIRMFAMSRCSKVFEKELKEELKKFFDSDNCGDYLYGNEYYHVVNIVFNDWTDVEQREYVKRIFDYFKEKLAESPDKGWIKDYGWRILSAAVSSLTEDEKIVSKEYFGKDLDPDFKRDFLRESRGGMVLDRSPIDISIYESVSALISDLKGELSPEILKEKYKNDDFLAPRNAEGVGNEMKKDMNARMSFYLDRADDFLDSELSIHYTYSLLRGVEEYLRDKQKLSKENWDGLFKLFNKIKEADKEEYKDSSDLNEARWIARWEWLEKMIADILKYFSTNDYSDLFLDRRGLVLELLEYLLESEDPSAEDENKDNGDLFTIAINSTRGVAFQAFVNLVYRDGGELKDDVLELYVTTVKKASLSVNFVIGHYLASFYFREKGMVRRVFVDIFSKGDGHEDKFFAAWEGYLSNSIYKELFVELQEYYEHALKLDSSSYPKRHEKRDIDKGIASHLALAFAHFDEVQYNEANKHELLETLWSGGDVKKQKEFISFLGRGIILHGNASKEWFEEKNVKLEKLKDFWTMILSRDDLDEDVYSAFGFWVNNEKEIFDYDWLAGMMADTLTKSEGKIDWEFGTLKKAVEFAKANPTKTLIILEKYLLEGILGGNAVRNWFHLDDEKISAFEELYEAMPKETKALINRLLEKGGRTFWPLKDIVD